MSRKVTIESLVDDVSFLGERLKDLVFADVVFWQTEAILQKNVQDDQAGHFRSWMEQGYVAMMCTGLRAIGDATQNTRSLLRVLDGIVRLRRDLNRQRFLAIDDRLDEEVLSRCFDNLAGAGNDLIPEDRIKQHITQLKSGLRVVQIYANNFVTHWGHNSQPSPTFKEVRDALKLSTEIHSYASEVLTGASVYYPQHFIWSNWTRIFRQPWLPKPSSIPPFRHFTEPDSAEHEQEGYFGQPPSE